MSFSRATSEAPPPHTSRLTSPVPNGKGPDAPPKPLAATRASSKPPTTQDPPPKPADKDRDVKPSAEKKIVDPVEEEPEEDDGEVIEMETFEQILELDEEDTHEFSYGMVVAYFEQAGQTFKEMDDAMIAQDLEKLSQLGHFLKGSSAALGITKVQETCEIIQHLGKLQEDGRAISRTEAVDKLKPLLVRVKKEYIVAERWLRRFYKDEEAAAAAAQ